MNKLVTFGDSFIAQRNHLPFIDKTRSTNFTWIDYVCRENNFRLDGYGDGGTGPYNAILNFLEYKEHFDVCFFVWSQIFRIFFNQRSVSDIKKSRPKWMDGKLQKDLTETYLKYFTNNDYEILKAKSMLQWFDRHLQKNYKNKKFIHFYAFVDYRDNKDENQIFYPHIFEHGINVKPDLVEFSKIGEKDDDDGYDPRVMHMIPEVHKSFAKQVNKLLKNKSLNNGDMVEFNLEN